MTTLGSVFSWLLYVSVGTLLLGLAFRIYQYASTPAPLKIPTTPAPITRRGVAARLAREVVFFESLFKASKWTWMFGWLFHAALLIVLLAHLRYFTEPVTALARVLAPYSAYAGCVMMLGLAGLWLRRLLVDRVRYISSPSDHLMLGLLVAIALTGLAMRFFHHTDIVAVKAFALGLVSAHHQPLVGDTLLLLHLCLVAVLLIVFPFSKLLHAPGVFFSPTRNQADNPRERRHVGGMSNTTAHNGNHGGRST